MTISRPISSPESRQRYFGKLPSLLGACALGAATAFAPAFADDTEVFFGQVDPDLDVFPNVLFVLDTSGSMNWGDAGYVGTRLERMKDALDTILDNTANVNVGVMRFNGSSGGGSVLFPVTPIDQQICEDGNCGAVSLIARINDDKNDVEEWLNNGGMEINGNILSMGENYSNVDQAVGYRFEDLEIPQGATITNAWLEFTAHETTTSAATLNIYAEAIDQAPEFTNTSQDLTDRNAVSTQVTWHPEGWWQNNIYQSPDISSVLQQVVDRTGWCGGNSIAIGIVGNGTRHAKSYRQSPTDATTLKVTYDSTTIPATGGCVRKTAVSAVAKGSDDAEERLSNNRVTTNSSDLELPRDGSRQQLVGIRFEELKIPRGAVIEEAEIEFEVDRFRSGNVTLKIQGHDVANSTTFNTNNRDISNRGRTASSVDWVNPPAAAQNAKIQTSDLSSIVQHIVDKSDWSYNNAMSFIIERKSGGAYRELESYNGEPSAAPKLRVLYRIDSGAASIEPTYITARDKLKQVVKGMTATGGTPIVDAYYEASQYFLGGDVDYGKQRGRYLNRYHRVSHPDSYTGGQLRRDPNCSDIDMDSYSCVSERIQQTPKYISPLESSCQTNHIVFLSDGAATSNSAANKVKALTGVDSCTDSNSRQKCGVELAQWLTENDHNPQVNGQQNISTYTIGFNFSGDFLPDLASAGGGSYYPAESAADLVSVFQTILGDVLSIDTSFVAPGATVNQFNRLTHRDDIYFAMFKPTQRPTWSGNLKRYKVEESAQNGAVEIVDYNGDPAVDASSGFFSSTSRSWWLDSGAANDGNSVSKGGAAGRQELSGIPGIGNRRVYTYTGDSSGLVGSSATADLTANAYKLSENNNDITLEMLGIQGMTGSAADKANHRQNLLKWARGVDVLDENDDDDTTDSRHHMGDPMHSRPVILNYADSGGESSMVFVSTNEGYLHAIDTVTGHEQYAFVPQELLQNLNVFYDNQSSNPHPYGLDGSISVWMDDQDDNVRVNNGEKAFIYIGMRRGGNNYYALDVSDRLKPKLAWVIKGGPGGTPGFEELGQSWSRPTPAKIMLNNQERQVLIFAAGYDTKQDGPSGASKTDDTIGRGLFIVDAKTGERLWAALGTSGGDQQFSDMDYSMPAGIRVIDVDSDGLVDQMYVGDMGGQLWRFDVVQYHQSGDLLDGGVMAKIGGIGKNDRRFYYEPDVALIAAGGKRFLSVSIGSGWRSHPLNTYIEDRFYMFRSNAIYEKPAGYGKETSPHSGVYSPVTEDDLVQITHDLNPETNDYGWYLDMEQSGEKVLGSSVTFNGQIVFASYLPDLSVGACSTAIGGGQAYIVQRH